MNINYVNTKKTITLPSPNSCKFCGIDMQNHGDRSSAEVGLHMWEAPTNQQRKARMIAIRNLKSLYALDATQNSFALIS